MGYGMSYPFKNHKIKRRSGISFYIILYFISRLLRSTRRFWNLLGNLYCVTKTLCKLIISLPMVSLLRNLCENTATLLTQIKLISRADAPEMIVALEKGHLLCQMGNVTSVFKKAISRKTADQQDMVIVVTHPRIQ